MLRRMKTGKNRIENPDAPFSEAITRIMNYINGSIANIMFLNMKSAILQLISGINYINWDDNNPLAVAAAAANAPQYLKDFMMLINSDYMKDRRAGLKINVSESEIFSAAKSKNALVALLGILHQKGFVLTKAGDSFAIASGGALFFRNRFNTYKKAKNSDKTLQYTEAQAKAKAMEDFREITENNQQSSRADKISMQQASSVGRFFLAFANTSSQYSRIVSKAVKDWKNGRGDPKKHASRILYYGTIQGAMFSFLQQGLFTIFLSKSDDDDDKTTATKKEIANKKTLKAINGILDSHLRGLGGVTGSAISMLKNMAILAHDKTKRQQPKFAELAYEPLKMSPPISSKITKLKQAASIFDYELWEIKNRPINSLTNPAILATGRVFGAALNVPLDRVVIKLQNLQNANRSDLETYQRIFSALGWSDWELGIDGINDEEESKQKKDDAEEKKRETYRNKKAVGNKKVAKSTAGMNDYEKSVHLGKIARKKTLKKKIAKDKTEISNKNAKAKAFKAYEKKWGKMTKAKRRRWYIAYENKHQ